MKKNKHKNKLKKAVEKHSFKKRAIRKLRFFGKKERIKSKKFKKKNKKRRNSGKIKAKKPDHAYRQAGLSVGRRKKIIFSEADMSAFVEKGKIRGFVTEDEILRAIPNVEENIGLVEELYGKLAAFNIEIKSSQEFLSLPREEDKKTERKLRSETKKSKAGHAYWQAGKKSGRPDFSEMRMVNSAPIDSVQMYLQEKEKVNPSQFAACCQYRQKIYRPQRESYPS